MKTGKIDFNISNMEETLSFELSDKVSQSEQSSFVSGIAYQKLCNDFIDSINKMVSKMIYGKGYCFLEGYEKIEESYKKIKKFQDKYNLTHDGLNIPIERIKKFRELHMKFCEYDADKEDKGNWTRR